MSDELAFSFLNKVRKKDLTFFSSKKNKNLTTNNAKKIIIERHETFCRRITNTLLCLLPRCFLAQYHYSEILPCVFVRERVRETERERKREREIEK